MSKKFFLTLLGLFFSVLVFGQKEGNFWYFGQNAGIDFNSGGPVSLSDGALVTNEGCATISDKDGRLLFYTDGVSVWDRTHHKMPNGTGLAGDPSSTQSGIIVPKPLNPGIYYVFTVDKEAGPKGLQYSVVDMTKNGGLGDVTQKNIFLRGPVCEKLTAVQHVNKKDVWVIAHDWDSYDFAAYAVTENGVSGNPILSNAQKMGGDISGSIGYLKVSPGGTYLASAIKPSGMDLFRFDNASGVIKRLTGAYLLGAYGVEFSSDNNKLYVTDITNKKLYQFDLSSGDALKITNSMTLITQDDVSLGALQLGPDRKIYVSRSGSIVVGVINRPNELGSKCNYLKNGLTLTTGTCRSGLPTFVQSFFEPVSTIEYGSACAGQPVAFQGHSNITPDSWSWDFGDPASGKFNYSSDQNPSHTYQVAGSYNVQLVIRVQGIDDTVLRQVKVLTAPRVDLGKDLVRCLGETIKLDAGNPGMKYRWSTKDSTQKITVNKSGAYWVTVSNGECSAGDTVEITLIDPATVNIGKDTIACKGDTITLTSSVANARHFWTTGDTTASTVVTKTSRVIGLTIMGSCLVQDTVMVTFIDPPKIDLGPTRMICEGVEEELDAGNTGAKFLWSTGETTQRITVTQGGDYWVKVSGGACSASDTLHLQHCRALVYVPNAFTPNSDGRNDKFRVFGSDIVRGTLTITNRWGERVWQGDSIFDGWDGTFRHEKCPDGVYRWSLLYWEYDGDIQYPREVRGNVTLLRQ